MDCPYCPTRDPEQKVVFESDLVLFLQDERYQGALRHPGVIIPIQHRETVFNLSDAEIAATFQLLARVKEWMDRRSHRMATTLVGTAAESVGRTSFMPTCTSSRGLDRSRSRERESGPSSSQTRIDGDDDTAWPRDSC
jgi:histidine triad (HIT) family protein